MLDCLGGIHWISVHSSHLCHLPQGTPTAHYRLVLTRPWLPPHSHRSRWTTSTTSRTLRVSWHWPRRMPPPSPSLMPNTMYASRRLGRTTRPTCEWKDQGLGKGSPCPALCSPGPLSLSPVSFCSPGGHQCQETGRPTLALRCLSRLLCLTGGWPDLSGGWWGEEWKCGCPDQVLTDRLPCLAFWQVQAVGGHVLRDFWGTGHLCSGSAAWQGWTRSHHWGGSTPEFGGGTDTLAGAGQQHSVKHARAQKALNEWQYVKL